MCVNNGSEHSYCSFHFGFLLIYARRLTRRRTRSKWSPSNQVFGLKCWSSARSIACLRKRFRNKLRIRLAARGATS